jgi:predicted nucleotidyltransferase
MQPMPSLTVLAETVRDVCRSHPVTLAYLFGSHARGTADAESDIDIALLVAPAIPNEERFDLRLTLRSAIAVALGRDSDSVDLVILQDVPVLLRYNVLRKGHLLFATDIAARRAFEREVENAYADESPYLDREADITLGRILSHAA